MPTKRTKRPVHRHGLAPGAIEAWRKGDYWALWRALGLSVHQMPDWSLDPPEEPVEGTAPGSAWRALSRPCRAQGSTNRGGWTAAEALEMVMPTKRVKRQPQRHGLTEAALAAWRIGDKAALRGALGIKPWQISPFDVAGYRPTPGRTPNAYDQSWPRALELRKALMLAAGPPGKFDRHGRPMGASNDDDQKTPADDHASTEARRQRTHPGP